jgi:hypothetical protein
MRALFIAAAAAAFMPAAASATVLTFDVAGGVTNSASLPQAYGDFVAGSPQAGHSYGVGAEGFTPNVEVTYGDGAGEQPNVWTTSYGDLTNIYFNDLGSDTTLTTTFTAAAGYLVDLYSFDLASFVDAGQTIQGFLVRDVGADSVLFSQGSTFITGASHYSATFATPLSANTLQVVVNLAGLNTTSDDIGMDNIRFGQRLAPADPPGVPEPATWALMLAGFFGAGAMLRDRRRTMLI